MNEPIELRPTFDPSEAPVACQLDAIPDAERAAHFALTERLFAQLVRERKMESDGFRCRFDAAHYADVVAFVADERLCCAFLTFTITVTPGGGPVELHLAGDPEVISAIFALPEGSIATTATAKPT